jgi:CheY-like chemotaxis protein
LVNSSNDLSEIYPARPGEIEWHEAMWVVAASLNDRLHASADARVPLEELTREYPALLDLMRQNRGDSPVSRVAMYYAFLFDPSLVAAEHILNAMDPTSEEIRFGRALLPWMKCVSWIAARMEESELIQQVKQKIDAVQMGIPSRMTSRGEFAIACQFEVHQHIRPWIALAGLANDYVETREQMKSGRGRTMAMTAIAQKMRALADAPEVTDLERVLKEAHAGRRLIGYAVLSGKPNSYLRAQIVSSLIVEVQPFLQYWGLAALGEIVNERAPIKPDEFEKLEPLSKRWDENGDRAGLLTRILKTWNATPEPLAGKRILWADDNQDNIENLVREFREAGAVVETVVSTEEALSALSKGGFDLLLSDLHRESNPRAGFEMVVRLRESGITVRTAFYSRYFTAERQREATVLAVPSYGDPEALRAAVMAWQWPVPGLPKKWVRVTGTGRRSGLPEPVQIGAELTGLAVAREGLGLITGGRAGVDHIAGRTLAARIEAQGMAVDGFLVHVVEGSLQPDLNKGVVERFDHASGHGESVNRADVVVVVGGEGGAAQTVRIALAVGKPVIPLARSGGDAERIWKLLQLAPGAASLQSPRWPLTDRNATLSDGVAALAADLNHPPNLTAPPGPFIVELVTVILPHAAEYMRPVPMQEFERTASRMREQLRPWGNSIPATIGVLLGDSDREWRVTGYLAFQTHPEAAQIPALLASLDAERKEIEAGRETRPFFQWLNSVFACVTNPLLRKELPGHLTSDLRDTLALLESRTDVDQGGECKSFLRSILSRLATIDKSSAR